MEPYTVTMMHKMRSVQSVVADSIEEARQLAYEQSFEDTSCWEEIDTEYWSVREG